MRKLYIWIIALAATLSCVFAVGTVLSTPARRQTKTLPSYDKTEERAPSAHADSRVPRPRTIVSPAASSPPAPPSVEEESSGMTADEFSFRVERMFDSDQPATREAMDRDRAIRDAFTAPDLKGVTFESSECRAKSCRVRLKFDDMYADRDVLNRMLLDPRTPFTQGMGILVPTREELADGRVATTMYLYSSPPDEGVVD